MVQEALLFLFITTESLPPTFTKLCPQSTWKPDLSSQPPPPQVHSGLKTLQQGEESSVTRLCYVAALKGEQGILAA